MDAIPPILLAAGALVFVAIALGAVSTRLGMPALLVFLMVGSLAGEIAHFSPLRNDFELASYAGSLALAVILMDGGLRTRPAVLRSVLAPAAVLASIGVVLTAAVVGAVALAVFGWDWRLGLLAGAVVGSTDAAAVFAILRNAGLALNERVEATLEVESGLNDPMAVFLTLAAIALLQTPALPAAEVGLLFVQQLLIGLAGGLAGGVMLVAVMRRVRLDAGLLGLLLLSGGLVVCAATSLLGGSGFLAVYLAGVWVARRAPPDPELLRVNDGLAWLAQVGMFLLLGLLADPFALAAQWPLAVLALAVILIARPLAVAACLAPFAYPPREIGFIAAIGLRGAVPIVLAIFALAAGVPDAQAVLSLAFYTVVFSLILQGGALRPLARVCAVEIPPAARPEASIAVGGEAAQRWCVSAQSRLAGRAPAAIEWPARTRWLAARRNGQELAEDEALAAGDEVLILAAADCEAELGECFAAPPAPGEWRLDPQVRLGDLAEAYGLELPPTVAAAATLDDYLRRRLRGRPATGDRVRLGALELVVRRVDGARVLRVGLALRH